MRNLFLALLLTTSLCYGVTANKVWRIPIGGTKPSWGPINLADTTNAVTGILPQANLTSRGRQVSSASGSASIASATLTDLNNLSVTITTNGNPVMLMVQSDGGTTTASPYIFRCVASSVSAVNGPFCYSAFVRNGTVISMNEYSIGTSVSGATTTGHTIETIVAPFLDQPSAGTYTYKIQGAVASPGSAQSLVYNHLKLVAFEL
jgi:hypothetical protein